ncbi:MAG: phage holin family protein [Acidobacteriota bacterium]
MWNPKRLPEQEQEDSGVFSRLKDAFAATKGLIATRVEIFREEVSEKGSLAGRGAMAIGIALVVGWLAMLLFTALVAVLLANLLASVWLGLLVAFVLYLAGAGVAALVGIKSLKKLNPFHFPATSKGLKEDWAAIRESVRPPAHPIEEDEDDLEARFRAGSE